MRHVIHTHHTYVHTHTSRLHRLHNLRSLHTGPYNTYTLHLCSSHHYIPFTQPTHGTLQYIDSTHVFNSSLHPAYIPPTQPTPRLHRIHPAYITYAAYTRDPTIHTQFTCVQPITIYRLHPAYIPPTTRLHRLHTGPYNTYTVHILGY